MLPPPPRSRGPLIVELGAGTGLVSLVLGKALPHLGIGGGSCDGDGNCDGATVVATDYTSITFEWTIPSNGGDPITSFYLEYHTGTDPDAFLASTSASTYAR